MIATKWMIGNQSHLERSVGKYNLCHGHGVRNVHTRSNHTCMDTYQEEHTENNNTKIAYHTCYEGYGYVWFFVGFVIYHRSVNNNNNTTSTATATATNSRMRNWIHNKTVMSLWSGPYIEKKMSLSNTRWLYSTGTVHQSKNHLPDATTIHRVGPIGRSTTSTTGYQYLSSNTSNNK